MLAVTLRTTLPQLTEYLREKRPKWPVPLTTGVTSGGGGGGADESETAAATDGDNNTFNHGPISKDVAAGDPFFCIRICFQTLNTPAIPELLLANGGAEKPGKFLFRQPDNSGNNFILSVVYKGQATHHKVARSGAGAEFEVNKTPTGCTSLSQVRCNSLQSARHLCFVPISS